MMNVSVSDAYDVACRELGEAKVREHFLTQEVARLNAELENAQRMYEDATSAAPASDSDQGWTPSGHDGAGFCSSPTCPECIPPSMR